MLKFLTSLSFLYLFTIGVLLLYGWSYYREFSRFRRTRKRFPLVFILVSLACFLFLWINFHPPMSLRTFSNLDHHFIQHKGFLAKDRLELGRSDTSQGRPNNFSQFIFQKKDGNVSLASPYSEEPLFVSTEKGEELLSIHYPVAGSVISLKTANLDVTVSAITAFDFVLRIGEEKFTASHNKKSSTAWNLFKDIPAFVNSPFYPHGSLSNCLRNIYVIDNGTVPSFFISGKLFTHATSLRINDQPVKQHDLAFTKSIPFKSKVGWGITINSRNTNRFVIEDKGRDGFGLIATAPLSYPLIEEHREDWTKNQVNKFLVSSSTDMTALPSILREGFMFSNAGDTALQFQPAWLSYEKSAGNKALKLNIGGLQNNKRNVELAGSQFLLPAKTANVSWIFTIRDTSHWDFGSISNSSTQWQLILFGSLFFFFLLVIIHAVRTPTHRLSWVWQLLSCLSLVLITTRFFLYWRYKTFPPYEGLDAPSLQQLNSYWNFYIIVLATVLLALVFGFEEIKGLITKTRKLLSFLMQTRKKIPIAESGGVSKKEKYSLLRFRSKSFFLLTWFAFLGLSAAVSIIRGSDASTTRHLSVGLILFYFLAVFVSYKHSPLVVPAEKAWWKVRTGNWLDAVIANPIKLLLSLSLLAVFTFMDIGFAIVFLNFILFHEAFLYINYSIAGLSGGNNSNNRGFAMAAVIYLSLFVLNLLFAPAIFNFLLGLPEWAYLAGYALVALILTYSLSRTFNVVSTRKKTLYYVGLPVLLFAIAFLFFPRDKILAKAEMTKYRVAVMTMPVDQAIRSAYAQGDGHDPVIRAAQNQWFINTFIYEENNPAVRNAGFTLLPHAPQNKGAKYNAQATDLVTSRFFIAEHGNWSVILYVLLLLIPAVLLASFYKIYPDFTNRINPAYPAITVGFSLLNYLMVTALLVILAATGRYIFFGQDLPFESILSKQSIIFPCLLFIGIIFLFSRVGLEQYPNKKKFIPGAIVFLLLAGLLFFAKPLYNKSKDFRVANLAGQLYDYIQLRFQPILDHIDTSAHTRHLTIARKDQLFADSIRKIISGTEIADEEKFFSREMEKYSSQSFSTHLDQRGMIYLDISSGQPKLEVNENYFRVEPPPHLQQYWTGNVYGDSSVYNLSLWDAGKRSVTFHRLENYTDQSSGSISPDLSFNFHKEISKNLYGELWLINGGEEFEVKKDQSVTWLNKGDSLLLENPSRYIFKRKNESHEKILVAEPDAFMKNYFVNGSRYYVYPLEEKFTWARHFAESISSDYVSSGRKNEDAFVSLDPVLTDSISMLMAKYLGQDTAYKKAAEYGITLADGDGRLIALPDYIKNMARPDPNDKAVFNRIIHNAGEIISQSILRRQVGNINLLRLHPGPGSTLKPIVFAAIASQMNVNWDAFSSDGFFEPRHFFGGEKVAEYDFEKYNGKISSVKDYLRLSDNYYHSNLLWLGSYDRQSLDDLLGTRFVNNNPGADRDGNAEQWPNFSYAGRQYFLNGFENWPGYDNGKANFGSDSSFLSLGLQSNFGISTKAGSGNIEKFSSPYDSSLLMHAYRRSGFLMPELALFDQQGRGIDHRIPYDLFTFCFRGHVKGSSQVMIPPVKMLDAYGKLITQNKNYSLTLNPYARATEFSAFTVDASIRYNHYLALMREQVFAGMREALFNGTAARLGSFLRDGSPYYYYAKTGTTGDNEKKTKSKLLTIIVSQKDITDPDFNFRNNKFYIIYFTSQNGPAKQNEEFQAEVIKLIQRSKGFLKYMSTDVGTDPRLIAGKK